MVLVAYCIRFCPNNDAELSKLLLYAYVDSDWAGDIATRRSTTGFILLLGGMPITWKSQLQPCVTLSSTEAEYVAACLCAQEVMWLRRLMEELGAKQVAPTTVYEDNDGCIALSKNPRN